MSQTITIPDSGLAIKDPSDALVYQMDWDNVLGADVEISTSTYVVAGVKGDITTTPLTGDQESILSGSRSTQVRLSAGAVGSKWRIDNRIVTNETPAQTIERSFFVKVEQR